MKKEYILFAILVILVGGYFFYQQQTAKKMSPVVSPKITFDPKNAVYSINNAEVILKDGLSEVSAAPGSASKIITRYFGNEAKHDFDGDGREDSVFILTQETGGTGNFFYVAVLLNIAQGSKGSAGFFLGDRIAPQSISVDNVGIIAVNFADRNPGESFSIAPSLGKTIRLKFDVANMRLDEIKVIDQEPVSVLPVSTNQCQCPDGYRKEGEACNPECYYSTPQCLMPSIPCQNSAPKKCGIENCHGLDIACGPNVVEMCTEIYQIGDRCRQFASCQEIEGQCQLQLTGKFTSCKACVQKCLDDNKTDNIKSFECESKCGQ